MAHSIYSVTFFSPELTIINVPFLCSKKSALGSLGFLASTCKRILAMAPPHARQLAQPWGSSPSLLEDYNSSATTRASPGASGAGWSGTIMVSTGWGDGREREVEQFMGWGERHI